MLEIRKHSEYNLIPPTPPCIDCRRKRMNSECYKWCDLWNEYAEKYQAFVRERDEVKKARVKEADDLNDLRGYIEKAEMEKYS